MYTTVPMEAAFFLASLAAGGIAAFVFDLLRISRRLMNPSDALVNLEDVLFLVFSALILFGTAYLKNSGEIRWQGFLGFGLGAGIYALVVRNRVLNVSTVVIKWLVSFVARLLKILLFPARLVLRIFRKPVRVIAWHTGRGARRIRRLLRRWNDRMLLKSKKISFILRKK